MLALLTRTAATRAARPLLPRTLPSSTAPRAPAVAIRRASTESNNVQARTLFSRFAKLDPELYGILAVTVGAVSAFAYYFAGNPTGTSDSRNVPAVPGSEPWRKEGATASGKYMYYPGGDVHSKPKEAPSALNVAVIPKVNLPKELHEKYNKWGKDGYDF